jgi:elongation factor P
MARAATTPAHPGDARHRPAPGSGSPTDRRHHRGTDSAVTRTEPRRAARPDLTTKLEAAPVVSTNNLKNGMTLLIDDKLQQVVENAHHKPGKGQAVVRTKLKEVETGKVVERTFRAGEDLQQAIVERKTLQFLYKEGADFILMDSETYDQQLAPPAAIGEAADYLVEGDELGVLEYDGRLVGVELPASKVLEIAQTDPGLAGNTATSATKPATLETGKEIQVPLFIEIGEKVKVDTRSGSYISRA